MKTIRQTAKQCMKDEADAILGLQSQLDENFDKAVDLMFHCRGKIIVTGVGKSGHIGAKIAATLSSTGTPSFFVNPLDVFHGDLGVMTHDDVVIAISNSGQTDELLRFIPMVLHMNIPIIAMTADAFSENVTECLNAGMNGHIAKPIDIKLVIKEIRRIKEGREKR